MSIHISEIRKRTAANVAGTEDLEMDPYHEAIRDTARQLVESGRGDWLYIGQYSSMSCIWKDPIYDTTSMVTPSYIKYINTGE